MTTHSKVTNSPTDFGNRKLYYRFRVGEKFLEDDLHTGVDFQSGFKNLEHTPLATKERIDLKNSRSQFEDKPNEVWKEMVRIPLTR